MNEKLKEKVETFLEEATTDSILKDCEDFGIKLDDIEEETGK